MKFAKLPSSAFLFLSLLIGCSYSDNVYDLELSKGIKIVEKGFLTIPIDFQTSYSPRIYGYSSELDLFYLWNEYKSSLQLYDLKERVEKYNIFIETGPATGINRVELVSIKSLDSIKIYDKTTRKLHLYNSYTKKLQSFQTIDMQGRPAIDVNSLAFGVNGQSVFLPLKPREDTPDSLTYAILKFNFSTNNEALFLPYSEDYKADETKLRKRAFLDLHPNGDLLYSFPFDDEYLVMDPKNGVIKKRVPSVSPLMKPYQKAKTNSDDVERLYHNLSQCNWYMILYDSHRDLIYRLGQIGQALPKELPESVFSSIPYTLSINGDSIFHTVMVYDTNHNLLGEVNASPSVSFLSKPIPTPYGILQLKTQRTGEENEDELIFYVFEIEQIN